MRSSRRQAEDGARLNASALPQGASKVRVDRPPDVSRSTEPGQMMSYATLGGKMARRAAEVRAASRVHVRIGDYMMDVLAGDEDVGRDDR